MPAHLALVEPLIWNDVLDRPDLGVAHLVACANEAGFATQVITGQTHFLHQIFIEDGGAEVRELFASARPDIEEMLGKHGVRRLEEQLEPARLAELYARTVGSDRIEDFLDTHRVKLMDSLVEDIFRVYRWHVRRLGNLSVSVVEDTVRRIEACEPKVVGFSAKYSFDFITRAIIGQVKKRLDVPVVLGGSRLVYLRGDEIRQVLIREGIDFAVIGPGEAALVELLKALEAGDTSPSVPNLFYVRDGGLVDHGMGVETDLESLPTPDFSQFDLDRYLSPVRILPLQYARGCSWRRCTFCAHHAIYLRTYHSFKRERMQEIVSELRTRHDTRHFALHDEELPPADCRRLSNALLENGPRDVRFFMYGRAVDRFDRATLETMYAAGFRAISWGLESMVQRVLDLMEKGTKVDEVVRVLRDAREVGIANLCFLIFGFPGESLAEAKQTVAELAKTREWVDYLLPNHYLLDPSSPAANEPARFGIEVLTPEQDSDPADIEYAYLPNFRVAEGLQPDEAERFVNEFNTKAMFNIHNVTSDRFKFFPPGAHVSRMLLFLLESDGLAIGDELDRLIEEEPADLRPLVLGSFERAAGQQVRWRPMRHDETALVNDLVEPTRVELDARRERILTLCDGDRTLSEIGSALVDEVGIEAAEAAAQVGEFMRELRRVHRCLIGLRRSHSCGAASQAAVAPAVRAARSKRPRARKVMPSLFKSGRVKAAVG